MSCAARHPSPHPPSPPGERRVRRRHDREAAVLRVAVARHPNGFRLGPLRTAAAQADGGNDARRGGGALRGKRPDGLRGCGALAGDGGAGDRERAGEAACRVALGARVRGGQTRRSPRLFRQHTLPAQAPPRPPPAVRTQLSNAPQPRTILLIAGSECVTSPPAAAARAS
eukprot:scaffold31034_cov79-Isochrysis_galbana.AAC.1